MDSVTIHGSMTPGIIHGTHITAHGTHGAHGIGADITMIHGMAAGMAGHTTQAGTDGATIHSGMAVHTGVMIHSTMTGTMITITILATSTEATVLTVSAPAIHGAHVRGTSQTARFPAVSAAAHLVQHAPVFLQELHRVRYPAVQQAQQAAHRQELRPVHPLHLHHVSLHLSQTARRQQAVHRSQAEVLQPRPTERSQEVQPHAQVLRQALRQATEGILRPRSAAIQAHHLLPLHAAQVQAAVTAMPGTTTATAAAVVQA